MHQEERTMSVLLSPAKRNPQEVDNRVHDVELAAKDDPVEEAEHHDAGPACGHLFDQQGVPDQKGPNERRCVETAKTTSKSVKNVRRECLVYN